MTGQVRCEYPKCCVPATRAPSGGVWCRAHAPRPSDAVPYSTPGPRCWVCSLPLAEAPEGREPFDVCAAHSDIGFLRAKRDDTRPMYDPPPPADDAEEEQAS